LIACGHRRAVATLSIHNVSKSNVLSLSHAIQGRLGSRGLGANFLVDPPRLFWDDPPSLDGL
jgi:hypothetical protein